MSQKIRIGIVFGGKSTEHEVSIRSARNVYDALDKEKYEPLLIGIDKEGHWHLGNTLTIEKKGNGSSVALIASSGGQQLVGLQASDLEQTLDVVFPILHGPFGEDGTVQGLLKLLNIPFVGASVLGSAIGMDKDVMKRLLKEAGIPIAPFTVITKKKAADVSFESLVNTLGLPFFLKPTNAGSSVGVSKVKTKEGFVSALQEAFRYDTKVICEEYIEGREIEFAVLGMDDPIVSLPGEVVVKHEFYSYEAKYLDETGAELIFPAIIDPETLEAMQLIAKQVFSVLCCEMMARIDFFLCADGRFFVNEINTIPGFTNISMYPKLMEISGIPYKELIDTLVNLAIERHEEDKLLENSYFV